MSRRYTVRIWRFFPPAVLPSHQSKVLHMTVVRDRLPGMMMNRFNSIDSFGYITDSRVFI